MSKAVDSKENAQQARNRAREATSLVHDLRRMLGMAMAKEASALKDLREAERRQAIEGAA